MADYKSTSIDGVDDIQDQAGNERLETILGVEVDTSTGAVLYDITGIPSGIKEFTMMFFNISVSGSSPLLIQLGTSSGFQITDYNSTSSFLDTTGNQTSATNGFVVRHGSSTRIMGGAITFRLQNPTSFNWVCNGMLIDKVLSNVQIFAGGNVSLTGLFSRIRLTTVNGTDTYDNGVMNIQMRF